MQITPPLSAQTTYQNFLKNSNGTEAGSWLRICLDLADPTTVIILVYKGFVKDFIIFAGELAKGILKKRRANLKKARRCVMAALHGMQSH